MGLLVQHAQATPIRPSARTSQPIPPELDDLVLCCLAKDPAQRPQSARELSLRLAKVEGADAWTQERAREWWARHDAR
jgi:serine/threonine-protein kinase